MVKALAALCISTLLCACAGFSGARTVSNFSTVSPYWITLPSKERLVILGVTGRQWKKESEIDNAREDAARKVSMYHSLWANVESVQRIGAGFFDYYTASEVNLEYDEDLEKYKDSLVFDDNRDIFRNNDGVFIRFSYPASFPGTINHYFARDPDGRPEWTRNPPKEINGFMAGVGFSGKQWKLRETFDKSRDSAIAALASQMYTYVVAQEASSGYESTSVIRQRSMGLLEYFLVLETWVDPDTRGVWTLAVAKKFNSP